MTCLRCKKNKPSQEYEVTLRYPEPEENVDGLLISGEVFRMCWQCQNDLRKWAKNPGMMLVNPDAIKDVAVEVAS